MHAQRLKRLHCAYPFVSFLSDYVAVSALRLLDLDTGLWASFIVHLDGVLHSMSLGLVKHNEWFCARHVLLLAKVRAFHWAVSSFDPPS